MATTPSDNPGGAPALLAPLARRPREFGYGLFALAALWAVLPLVLLIRARMQQQSFVGPVFLWGLAMAALSTIMAMVQVAYTPSGGLTEADKPRLVLLWLGGAGGLLTALLGVVLALTEPYRPMLAGGLASWRKNPGALAWPGLALFAGLLVMFLTLQLGRGLERTNPTLRRLMYGFNAVLASLLLLLLLAVCNVLAYAEPFARALSRPYNWRQSGFTDLQPGTRDYVAALQEPVKVYLLMPETVLTADLVTLLEKCRAANPPKFSWQLLDLYSPRGQLEAVALTQKYKAGVSARVMRTGRLEVSEGLLVVVGTEPKTSHDFIPANDLSPDWPMLLRDPTAYRRFTGEGALMNALTFLTEGKVTVYFVRDPGSGPAGPMAGGSLGRLRARLGERKNTTVKDLDVGTGRLKVPDDATAVVLAGLTRTLPRGAADGLDDYLRGKRKGKLLALLDPVLETRNDSKVMAPTGLERLLGGYGVRLGDDLVLSLRGDDPYQVLTITNPDSSNPVARAFFQPGIQRTVFTLDRVRSVEPQTPPGRSGGNNVDTILIAPAGNDYWVERNLNRNVKAYAEELRTKPEEQEKVLARRHISVGVAVAESSGGGVPRDPAHAGLFKETPRLVVFGSSSWVRDEALERRPSGFDLFAACLSWLRERPVARTASADATERKVYESIPRDNVSRIAYLPLGLAVLAVLGLACGVWVVRRR
jgi:hypothetical protein